MEVEEECFGEKFYIYYIKISIRPPSSNPIVILNNKGINKLSLPFFYINIIMEDKGTKNTKNKKNLKNL